MTHSLHCVDQRFIKKAYTDTLYRWRRQKRPRTDLPPHTLIHLQMDSRKITWPEAMALKKYWIMRHEEHLSPVKTSTAFTVTCWLGLDSTLRVVRTSNRPHLVPLGTRAWLVHTPLCHASPYTEITGSAGGFKLLLEVVKCTLPPNGKTPPQDLKKHVDMGRCSVNTSLVRTQSC